MTSDKRFIGAVNAVICGTFKAHVKRAYSLAGEGDPGHNRLTHPDTAGERLEMPQ